MKYAKRCSCLFISILLAWFLVVGCEEKTAEPVIENGNGGELKNPNQPNANHLIVSEHAFGDSTQENSIWLMDLCETGGFYFIGVNESKYGIGLLDGQGTLVWFEELLYEPKDVQAVDAEVFSGVLSVGSQDSDHNGTSNRGIASLIDSDGDIRDQLSLADSSSDIWLNAIIHYSDSIYVCVGGSRTPENEYPLLGLIYLTSDKKLSNSEIEIIEDLPHDDFMDVVIDTAQSKSASFISCYTTGVKLIGDKENITLHKVTFPIDSTGALEIEWSRDITAYSELKTSCYTGNALILVDDNLYIAGNTGSNKDPGGGYWSAGLVASVSTGGAINWIKPVLLSEFGDGYSGLFATSEALYAVGDYSSFFNTGTERYFGYGLITKVDLISGEITANLSFGNDQYSSGFNTILVDGTTAHSAGWTNDRKSDSGYQCWFVEIDLSKPLSAPIVSKNGEADMSGSPATNNSRVRR